MRLFEVPAHRIPLVTNQIVNNGLEELFDLGEHILVFKNEGELFNCIDRLLKDNRLRSKIAESGYRHVTTCHTYRHRMKQLLDFVWPRNRHTKVSPNIATATPPELPNKSKDYFEFNRPDVQALVPTTARYILDIGCGAGRLGEELKRSRNVDVTGIELNPLAVERARHRLDRVIQGSIDALDESTFSDSTFDAIIFADVLEHLRDPASILKKCRTWLAPNGAIIISVPNSRHHSVISGLINGNWSYERGTARRRPRSLFYKA